MFAMVNVVEGEGRSSSGDACISSYSYIWSAVDNAPDLTKRGTSRQHTLPAGAGRLVEGCVQCLRNNSLAIFSFSALPEGVLRPQCRHPACQFLNHRERLPLHRTTHLRLNQWD